LFDARFFLFYFLLNTNFLLRVYMISAIPLDNPTLIALTITIKVRHAYSIVVVLGGWAWDNHRSWWFAESTHIGLVSGPYVPIWT
jgi:hypothetical protein